MVLLKKYALQLNLPILRRKWKRIDINKSKRQSKFAEVHSGLVTHDILIELGEE